LTSLKPCASVTEKANSKKKRPRSWESHEGRFSVSWTPVGRRRSTR
jgi:hypothetical protein